MNECQGLASLGPNLSSCYILSSQLAQQWPLIKNINSKFCWKQSSLEQVMQNEHLSHHNQLRHLQFQHQQATSSYNSEDGRIQPPLSKFMLDYALEPMQKIDRHLDYYFSDIWTQNGDKRSSSLPFMSAGPWKLIYATIVYLYLIKWLLPRTMQNLRPFELNWAIRCYNLLMVISNIYAFYHGARILQFGRKCFGCEVINHKDYSPEALELLHYGWLFLTSRLVEWLDTIFFVLRKKQRQVTKLHVFHHSFVPILCWTYLKFNPGYTVAFFPFVNSFVHTIMYTYYFLATFGPKIQPYLWWKKYLTSLQIAQFVLILIQLTTIPLSSNEQCQYPRGFLYVAFAGAILFLWLFYTYYIDTYNTSKPTVSTAATPISSSSSTTFGPRNSCRLIRRRIYVREGSSRALSEAIDNAIDKN